MGIMGEVVSGVEFKSERLSTWNEDKQLPELVQHCEPVSKDHLLLMVYTRLVGGRSALYATHRDVVLRAHGGAVAVNGSHANRRRPSCVCSREGRCRHASEDRM